MSENAFEIRAELVKRASLSIAQQEAMLRLLQTHFDGVTRSQFEKDLAEKNWVILLQQGRVLVGFSTLLIYHRDFKGQRIQVVYSGDTIVTPNAWGTTKLARAWIGAVNALSRKDPGAKTYWLLLSSGYRTYRFLPVFWREFYPHYQNPAASEARALLNFLALDRFGSQFDAEKGVVRFPNPQPLAPGLCDLPEGRLLDPHVAFFLKANPGFARGDELVCLAELSAANLTRAGERMVRNTNGLAPSSGQ